MPDCERIGEHVAIPAKAVEETRRSHEVAGTCHRVGDVARGIARRWQVGRATRHRRSRQCAPSLPSSMMPSVRSSASATGFTNGATCSSNGRTCSRSGDAPRMAWAATCMSELSHGRPASISRGVVQPPWCEDLWLVQWPYVTARSIELHGVKQSVHRAPGRLVGAFHRREVGMSAHVVGRQKQVGNGGGRLGAQRPGVDQVHQQRLSILQEARVCRVDVDVRVEEPRMQVFVAQQFPADIDRLLELFPCLADDLFARALHGGASIRSRRASSRRHRPRGRRARRCRRTVRAARRARTGAAKYS